MSSKFRWLVVHHLDKESLSLNYWSDEDTSLEEDNKDDGISVGLFHASPGYTKLRPVPTHRFLDAHVTTKREWVCLVVILLQYVGTMKPFLEKIPTDYHYLQCAFFGGISTTCMDC
jgi:hypothetical protein